MRVRQGVHRLLSETDLSKRDIEGESADSSHASQSGHTFLALVLASLLALTSCALAYSVREATDPLILATIAAFGFVGLLCLFGTVAGFVHIGRRTVPTDVMSGLVIAQTEEICAVTDHYGRVIYASPQYRQIAGGDSVRKILGVEHLYAGYPDIADHIYRLAQAARDGIAATEEIRLVGGSSAAGAHPDRTAWLRLTVEKFEGAGKGQSSLWRIVDLTSERERQEAAFQKLQHIIDYLDHAPAGFFSADHDGRIQYLNATLAGWLGVDLAQTTGGALALNDIVSSGASALISSFEPTPEAAHLETFDMDLMRADGTSLPVRILHRVSFDADGSIGASRSLVLNRSPSSDVAETLRAAEVRFARFFNGAPIGIAIVGRDGRIKNLNTAFIRTAGEGAGRGRELLEIVAEDSHDTLKTALDSAWDGKAVIPAVDIRFSGTAERDGRFFVSRIEEDGDDSLLVYSVDTTEQRSLEMQFAQSQKMQAVGQLAGGVAHDFNNVLTAVIGFSDLLLARHRPTDPSFQDIMNIKQNANRAANLVRQLLAFSRRQTLRPEILSLTDVIADLGNLLGRLIGEKIELQIVHGRELGLVKVDVNQFEQVVINLAVNARDAMPDGGSLIVRTGNVSEEESRAFDNKIMPVGEYILCEVVDTGSGMSKDILEKIYEPFFSTKEVGKGTGLGLSTVYGIVKQTGGFIFAESVVDSGTTFRIYLPRVYREDAAEDETDTVVEKIDAASADTTGAGTILLVEDEEAVRAFASRALASRGYTVLQADSGETALVQLEAHEGEIDLVISDVVMPEMDGPTLLKELRKRNATMKVIFISGYAEDAFKKNLDENEVFGFLPKPFSLKQLAAAVKETLST